jgi:uncharacterized membrane protein YdfJ with MMPL/SSD domain
VFVKELGLGVAFAVILDATIVRGLLVPALMKLLGPASWWSPVPARKVQQESILPEPALVLGSTVRADTSAVK